MDRVARGKITYEAKAPKDIKFAPLNKDTEYTAEEMMQLYEVRLHSPRNLRWIWLILYTLEDRQTPVSLLAHHQRLPCLPYYLR